MKLALKRGDEHCFLNTNGHSVPDMLFGNHHSTVDRKVKNNKLKNWRWHQTNNSNENMADVEICTHPIDA